jgi:SOS-response transcriptional repressor LexA
MTHQEADLLLFIDKQIRLTSVCPSYVECAAHIGVRSKSGVHRIIAQLVAKGLLRRGPPGTWRSLTVVRQDVAPIPDGWVLVPVEPTREMWAHAASRFVNRAARDLHHDKVCGLVWEAMLSKAPPPPGGAL